MPRCPLEGVLAGLLVVSSSAGAGQPRSFESQPEVYTEFGEVSGCGLGFDAAWRDDRTHTLGISGTLIALLIIQKDTVAVLVRATGLYDTATTPLIYAWIQTSPYGKTTDFTVGPAEDPAGYMAFKASDPNAIMIPSMMAVKGFRLGVK